MKGKAPGIFTHCLFYTSQQFSCFVCFISLNRVLISLLKGSGYFSSSTDEII